MPRKLKGYKFLERQKDAFEEYKAIKLYTGIYGKDNVRVLRMVNQFGQPYTDIYVKEGAKQIRKLKSQFGSHMAFEPAMRKHKRFMRDKRYKRRGSYYWAGQKKTDDIEKIKNRINKLLYHPNADAVDKELMTIEIPIAKAQHLEFLKAYTLFNTQGVWHKIADDNLQIEIEFHDARNEQYGKELIKLFKELNRKLIKEQVLYVRTEPVEESSL